MFASRFAFRPVRKGLCVTSTALSLLVLGISQANAVQESASDSTSLNALTYDDTFNLEFVANPQFLNKDTVIYSRQSMNVMTDGEQSRLWQVNIKSGEHRPFIGVMITYRLPCRPTVKWWHIQNRSKAAHKSISIT